MPNWYCDCCSRRQSSKKRPRPVETPGMWPMYQTVHGELAFERDKICDRCRLRMRNDCGAIKNQRPHVTVFSGGRSSPIQNESSRSEIHGFENTNHAESSQFESQELDQNGILEMEVDPTSRIDDETHSESNANEPLRADRTEVDVHVDSFLSTQPSVFVTREQTNTDDFHNCNLNENVFPDAIFTDIDLNHSIGYEIISPESQNMELMNTTSQQSIETEWTDADLKLARNLIEEFPPVLFKDAWYPGGLEYKYERLIDADPLAIEFIRRTDTEHFEYMRKNNLIVFTVGGDVHKCSLRANEDAGILQNNVTESQQSASSQQSCASILSRISNRSRNITNKTEKMAKVHLPNIVSCIATQRKCFICNSKSNGRRRVPKSEISRIWSECSIRIPPNNRCCGSHFTSGKLSTSEVVASATRETIVRADEVENWIHGLSAMCNRKQQRIDFDFCDLEEDDYELLTGLSKHDFDDLFQYLLNDVKNSKNRSKRNALGILLVKLRLNVGHKFLQFQFAVKNTSTISDTIRSVSRVLQKNFVPQFLGYSRLSRQELLASKSVSCFNQLLNEPSEKLILILDGTYLFIEKPSNFPDQRKTFSMQKLRNLLKPMMIITTSGEIVQIEGLYGADGGNNDANILKHMLNNPESILSILETGDVLVLDRGFRDVLTKLRDLGIKPHMPNLLGKNEKQFSTEMANESRRVTLIRWLVEAVNGRIKNKFKFLAGVIRNSHIPNLKRYFEIACAMLNAYSPPLLTETPYLKTVVEKALARMEKDNDLRIFIEESGLERKRSRWLEADTNSMPDFSKLTLDDLKSITLGIYQIKLAENYCNQHFQNSKYKLLLCKDDDTLLRAKIESRFSSSKAHNLWIRYAVNGEGEDRILSSYCRCKSGSRTVGKCAHITSVLWYLGYARHDASAMKKKRVMVMDILDAAKEYPAIASESSEDSE